MAAARANLLVHPAEDKWTPLAISQPFFDRIRGDRELVRVRIGDGVSR